MFLGANKYQLWNFFAGGKPGWLKERALFIGSVAGFRKANEKTFFFESKFRVFVDKTTENNFRLPLVPES